MRAGLDICDQLCLSLLVFLFFKKMGPASLSFIFGLFQTNINTILQIIYVKKCPSNIWHWDSNPQPSERESPLITSRPGLSWSFFLSQTHSLFKYLTKTTISHSCKRCHFIFLRDFLEQCNECTTITYFMIVCNLS